MPASAETTATLRGLSPVADKPIIAAFDAEGFSASGGLLTRLLADCGVRR